MAIEWYVAQVKPHAEQIALRELANQINLNVFDRTFHATSTIVLPYLTRSGKRRRGELVKAEALFPGYIFIRFDIRVHDRWRSINGTRGVVKLLPHHMEDPEPVNGAFVDDLIDKTKDGLLTYEQALDRATQYAFGDEVRIIEGLAVGETGTYLSKYRSGGQLFLSLRQPRGVLKVPAQHVQPAPRSAVAMR